MKSKLPYDVKNWQKQHTDGTLDVDPAEGPKEESPCTLSIASNDILWPTRVCYTFKEQEDP